MSRQTINSIEKERYTPSLPLAIALARFFDTTSRGDIPWQTATARRQRPFWRSRWWMPLFALALGAAMFAAFAIGDDVRPAAPSASASWPRWRRCSSSAAAARRCAGSAVPAATSAGRRSTCARPCSPGMVVTSGDHRRVPAGRSPTATTASPYAQLGALAGIAYIVAVGVPALALVAATSRSRSRATPGSPSP